MNSLKKKAELLYWSEILELVQVLQSSNELGNHSLFKERLKYMQNKFKIKIRKEWKMKKVSGTSSC